MCLQSKYVKLDPAVTACLNMSANHYHMDLCLKKLEETVKFDFNSNWTEYTNSGKAPSEKRKSKPRYKIDTNLEIAEIENFLCQNVNITFVQSPWAYQLTSLLRNEMLNVYKKTYKLECSARFVSNDTQVQVTHKFNKGHIRAVSIENMPFQREKFPGLLFNNSDTARQYFDLGVNAQSLENITVISHNMTFEKPSQAPKLLVRQKSQRKFSDFGSYEIEVVPEKLIQKYRSLEVSVLGVDFFKDRITENLAFKQGSRSEPSNNTIYELSPIFDQRILTQTFYTKMDQFAQVGALTALLAVLVYVLDGLTCLCYKCVIIKTI